MRRNELLDVLQSRPFKPVRLFLTDGSAIDITHPDLCLLLRRTAIIGYPGDHGEDGDRFSIVDLAHVSRLDSTGTPNLTDARGEE